MEPYKGNPGAGKLAAVLAARMGDQAAEVGRPDIDFGEIGTDYSLQADSYPVPIPQSDYLVCRHLTLGETGATLTATAQGGEHRHEDGAHGGHQGGDGSHEHEGGGHAHDVPVPEKLRSLAPGDRVLLVWRGSDAVVIDIILPASAVGGGG